MKTSARRSSVYCFDNSLVNLMKQIRVITRFAIVAAVTSCDDGYLRGEVSKSADGKTYFAVIDDNGGQCGPMKLDGIVWHHSIGEIAEVNPGKHTLECGALISFMIPSGLIFKFDYWGP